MKTALIGYTGFVGSNLAQQFPFDDLYNSKNINEIAGRKYDLIISAGAKADRNNANQDPKQDWKGIKKLLINLAKTETKHFILISTIDVYPNQDNVNEDTPIKLKDLTQTYGRNRYRMELFVKKHFPKTTIIRCPNLFGENLKKNLLYDLIHQTNLEKRHKDSVLQYYNLKNLWNDIQKTIENNIALINFAVEPIASHEIALYTTGKKFKNITKEPPQLFNFKSKYSHLWGQKNGYLYNKKVTLQELRSFMKKEIEKFQKPKIAISNLAWEKGEDDKLLKLLKKYNIKKIEIAPSNIWLNPAKVPLKQIYSYREFWNKNAIDIVSTTHILSPYPKLTLFENPTSRRRSLNYLKKIVKVSSILGAQVINFGSPKNRKKEKLSNKEALNIAKDFFWEVAEECKKYNIKFAFEPVPTIYHTDFVNKTSQAITLAKIINHPNFGINIDSGTMTQNNENFEKTIKNALPYAFHFHISEPWLKPIPQKVSYHKKLARTLKKLKYNKILSIEMSLKNETGRIAKIEKALKFVTSTYN